MHALGHDVHGVSCRAGKRWRLVFFRTAGIRPHALYLLLAMVGCPILGLDHDAVLRILEGAGDLPETHNIMNQAGKLFLEDAL